jgi:predicted metal-dependent peptidase
MNLFSQPLSRRMEKVATKAVPTAGVKFNEDRCRFEMYYNPEFMNENYMKQNPTFVKGVLLHEFYHIVLLHVTSRIPGERMTKKWNVATDLAINSELTIFEATI